MSTHPPLGFPRELLNTLRNLVAYYVLRQQLVMMAMVELNPRALDPEVVDIDLEPYLTEHREKWLRYQQSYNAAADKEAFARQTLENAIWKGEWHHFVHGGGCRLTHLRTGEPLEWDGPNPYAFRIDWFFHHLEWRLAHETDDLYVRSCKTWLLTSGAEANVLVKAVYQLINAGEIRTLSGSLFLLPIAHDNEKASQPPLPQTIVQALVQTLRHYRDRQKLAIQAVQALRPDFIDEISSEPYLLAEVSHHVAALCPDRPLERGTRIQSGQWQAVWAYEIRYGVCTLKHVDTGEPIRWAISNPELIDYHGFFTHMMWRLERPERDAEITRINTWCEQFIVSKFGESQAIVRDKGYLSTGLRSLFEAMREQRVVQQLIFERGSLFKILAPDDMNA